MSDVPAGDEGKGKADADDECAHAVEERNQRRKRTKADM
jgi:hypothetical protein